MIRKRFNRNTMANITLNVGEESNQDTDKGAYVGKIVAVRNANFLFSVPPREACTRLAI